MWDVWRSTCSVIATEEPSKVARSRNFSSPSESISSPPEAITLASAASEASGSGESLMNSNLASSAGESFNMSWQAWVLAKPIRARRAS